MKANTSLSLDSAVLAEAKRSAEADGITLSAFAESALLDKVLRNSARIAVAHEQNQGRTSPEFHVAAAAEAATMVEQIRATGTQW